MIASASGGLGVLRLAGWRAGSEVFTATATDAVGNTSAPFNSVDRIIGVPSCRKRSANAGLLWPTNYIASSFANASVGQLSLTHW